MKSIPPISDAFKDLLPGLFLSILTAVLALPSLWDAWQNDLYAYGGFIAFLVWLSSLGMASFWRCHVRRDRSTFWIILAALLCMAGSMTSLRVCHHLALACALSGLARPPRQGWLAAAAALSWLPASGWLISRVSVGGLAGWERPTLAAMTAIIWLSSLYPFQRPRSDETPS